MVFNMRHTCLNGILSPDTGQVQEQISGQRFPDSQVFGVVVVVVPFVRIILKIIQLTLNLIQTQVCINKWDLATGKASGDDYAEYFAKAFPELSFAPICLTITFVPASDGATNGSFYLVNQSNELGGADPSIVFEVEIKHAAGETQARIIRYFSVGVTDLSGIHYVPSRRCLLIISDASNLLLEVSLTGQVLKTYPLPGKKQEGITTDRDGFLYIAQDAKEARLKFTSLGNANGTNQ